MSEKREDKMTIQVRDYRFGEIVFSHDDKDDDGWSAASKIWLYSHMMQVPTIGDGTVASNCKVWRTLCYRYKGNLLSYSKNNVTSSMNDQAGAAPPRRAILSSPAACTSTWYNVQLSYPGLTDLTTFPFQRTSKNAPPSCKGPEKADEWKKLI